MAAYLLVPAAAGTVLWALGKNSNQILGIVILGMLIAGLGVLGDAFDRSRHYSRRRLGEALSQATTANFWQDQAEILRNLFEASANQVQALREQNEHLEGANRLQRELLAQGALIEGKIKQGLEKQDQAIRVAEACAKYLGHVESETGRLNDTAQKIEQRSFRPLFEFLDSWLRARDKAQNQTFLEFLEMLSAEIDRVRGGIDKSVSELLAQQDELREGTRRDSLRALEAQRDSAEQCQKLLHGPEGVLAEFRRLIDEQCQIARVSLTETLKTQDASLDRILERLPASLQDAMQVPRREMSAEVQKYAELLESQREYMRTANQELDQLWTKILDRIATVPSSSG